MTFVACCALALDLRVSQSASQFRKSTIGDWPSDHSLLLRDAGLGQTRTLLGFPDPIPPPQIKIHAPSLLDRVLFRRSCTVKYKSHYKGVDGIAVLENTNVYTIQLFDRKVESIQEELDWAQLAN